MGSRWVRGRVTRFLVDPLGLLILKRWAECLCPVHVGWCSACGLGSCGWAVLGVAICGVLGFEGVRHVSSPGVTSHVARCEARFISKCTSSQLAPVTLVPRVHNSPLSLVAPFRLAWYACPPAYLPRDAWCHLGGVVGSGLGGRSCGGSVRLLGGVGLV